MKKILATLSLSLALYSCGSGAADGVNETPSSTGDRVFVVDTSKSVSKSVSKNISKGIDTSAWQTQYDSLISTINTKTGRNNNVDGYFVFDSYGNIKEMGIKSDVNGKFAWISKYSPPSSNLPILLYNDNPDFIESHEASTMLSQYDSSEAWYVTDNYIRTSSGLEEDMSASDGYTQNQIFASPTKNSQGEVESWYYNYNGLDGMEFNPITSVSLSNYTNPKYVFNSDKTISLYEGNIEIEKFTGSNVSYTYENGIVKTMVITVGTKTYNWKYDSQGRIIESTGPESYFSNTMYTTKYMYDSQGIVKSKTIHNDTTNTNVYASDVTYGLNSDSSIKSFVITIVDDGDSSTISMTYTRDASGNITNVHAKLMIPYFGSFEQDYIPKS